MSQAHSNYQLSDAEVFSRGSLKLTFDLLRKKNPQLALQVRNIMGNEPLERENNENDNPNAHHFVVTLDSYQLRAIVEGLMEFNQSEISAPEESGLAIMAKTLMEDWIVLAHKMVSQIKKE